MKKILITGAAGFIGFHLVKKLENEGFQITGVDNVNDYYNTDLKFGRLQNSGINAVNFEYGVATHSKTLSHYHFIKLDLKDKNAVLQLFADGQFDYVVHLAAQAGVRYSLINPHAYIDSNVQGFLNILEGCRFNKVQHLIFASSSSVYGANSKIPFEETDPVDNPVSLYAATKKSNELFAHAYAHLYQIPVTALRFFTVYGPWGRPDMAYFSFTKAILEGNPIKVFNEGKMKRDFTYIDDITNAIYKLLYKVPVVQSSASSAMGAPPFDIFNIGNNTPVELIQFIEIIENITGKKAVMEMLPMQPGDVPITYANISKLEHAIGTVNKTTIRQGLEHFIAWYRRYYNI